MTKSIYPSLVQSKKSGRKSFAVLIDPDKAHTADIDELLQLAMEAKVDYLLVGGSLVVSNRLDDVDRKSTRLNSSHT